MKETSVRQKNANHNSDFWDSYRKDTICFGGGDWWYHNRGHIDMQMMRRFSRMGTVLYVNSVVVQKPVLKKGMNLLKKVIRKIKSISRGLQRSDEGFWVYSPLTFPVHHIPWARRLNNLLLRFQIEWVSRKLRIRNPIVWLSCPAASEVAVKIQKDKLIYQRADRWEEFPNVDPIKVRESDRLAKSHGDLTVFVNSSLYEEEAKQCRKAFYLDHGVDYDTFSSASRDSCIPEDIAAVPGPIVGFFGGIDGHTFDMNLVEKVVDRLPKLSFVFVGSTSLDCTKLLSRENVWMLGQKPYEQIPHYGKCFDVAIMPWRQNRWIQACNPIKLKEYLALGKPVVSTPFPELQKYSEVVYQAETDEAFARSIQKALEIDSIQKIADRKKRVRHSSWDSKAELLLKELFDGSVA